MNGAIVCTIDKKYDLGENVTHITVAPWGPGVFAKAHCARIHVVYVSINHSPTGGGGWVTLDWTKLKCLHSGILQKHKVLMSLTDSQSFEG